MRAMMLFHRGNNKKRELDNMYWNSRQRLLRYWVKLVMMMNMEYSLVYWECRIMCDQMVRWMMKGMDRFLFENLEEEKSKVFLVVPEWHISGRVRFSLMRKLCHV